MAALTEKKLQVLAQQESKTSRREWDGGGLYADISPRGVVSFAMKYRRDGKERREGFGKWPSVSLAEARRKSREVRVSLDRGEAPNAARGQVTTFKQAADEWINVNDSRLKPRTMAQIRRYLGACINGFGSKLLADVKPTDVLVVLRKFENRKAYESAKRTRIYASAVFDYCIALELAHTNPAAPLKAKGVLRQRVAVVPHAAMPAEKIPEFLTKLSGANIHPSIRGALKFTVLTTLRTGEVLGLQWSDIAKDGHSLTIPAERMKGGKPHVVFLSKQARATLEEIEAFSEGRTFVFPGRDPNGPLSNMAMLMCLTRMVPGVTVHGFRSSFSTWAHAKGATPHTVERVLAHVSADKVAAAYNRHTYNREAAQLWQRWADLVAS